MRGNRELHGCAGGESCGWLRTSQPALTKSASYKITGQPQLQRRERYTLAATRDPSGEGARTILDRNRQVFLGVNYRGHRGEVPH